MPASLSWSSPPKPQVFPVFGSNKRKADANEQNDDSMDCGVEHQGTEVKRRCLWHEQGQGDGIQPQNIQMQAAQQQNGSYDEQSRLHQQVLTQKSPTKTWCSQVQQQQVHRSPSPWPMEQMPNNNTLPLQSQPQQNGFIMNINDETYSAPVQDQQACMAMDSDCIPDPSQYSTQAQCRDLCGGVGDTVPTSDQVRCFCRPSWDGVMALKPYVSDYY